jgi:hypothetical protein
MTDCVVCMDTFNKSTRAPTECPHCHVKICRTCLQTYVLGEISDTPMCVNVECRRGWEREFLDGEFTKSFRLTTYKEHREKILADREKARLPVTQENAATYKAATDIMKETDAELAELVKEERRIAGLMAAVERRQRVARAAHDTFGRLPIQQEGAPSVAQKATPVAFVKPCPAPDCKGFLSTSWKCGLCDLWTCPDCHDLKGPVRDCGHTCDPAKVATATLLAREAKSCPKCGVQICKIEGCDQMWCTVCNTGFNWRTGKIAEGPVHNPHYFDWLRRQGREPTAGGEPPLTCDQDIDRRVARALGGTGNYIYGYNYRPRGRHIVDTDDNYLMEAWRVMREVQDNERHEPNPDELYRVLRVKYMAGEVTEDDWKITLQRQEKDMNFQRAKSQVRELFAGACRDLIRGVLDAEPNKTEIRRQVDELVKYCNDSYAAITKRFGRKTPVIRVSLEA